MIYITMRIGSIMYFGQPQYVKLSCFLVFSFCIFPVTLLSFRGGEYVYDYYCKWLLYFLLYYMYYLKIFKCFLSIRVYLWVVCNRAGVLFVVVWGRSYNGSNNFTMDIFDLQQEKHTCKGSIPFRCASSHAVTHYYNALALDDQIGI